MMSEKQILARVDGYGKQIERAEKGMIAAQEAHNVEEVAAQQERIRVLRARSAELLAVIQGGK